MDDLSLVYRSVSRVRFVHCHQGLLQIWRVDQTKPRRTFVDSGPAFDAACSEVMAQPGQAPMVDDYAESRDTPADIDLAEIRGKMTKYDILSK